MNLIAKKSFFIFFFGLFFLNFNFSSAQVSTKRDFISLKSRPSAKITDGYVPVRYPEFEAFPLGIVRDALILGINQGLLTKENYDQEELTKKLLFYSAIIVWFKNNAFLGLNLSFFFNMEELKSKQAQMKQNNK